MPQLTLLRHGLSQWNLENRFSGWTDVDICKEGRKEAKLAGLLMLEEGFSFDRVYTSVLRRSIHTAWIVIDEMNQAWLPHVKDWHFNERHYGDLQGLDKAETAREHGDEKVWRWRRGFHDLPPAMAENDPRNPTNDSRYADLLQSERPLTESLEDVLQRTVSYWEGTLAPRVAEGDRVLIVAHGNTLRALVKYFDEMSAEAVEELDIPTGIPLVYELDDDLQARSRRYLGGHQRDLERVTKRIWNYRSDGLWLRHD